jgi:hypothetical protein
VGKNSPVDGVTGCFVSKALVIRKILHELKFVKEISSWEHLPNNVMASINFSSFDHSFVVKEYFL